MTNAEMIRNIVGLQLQDEEVLTRDLIADKVADVSKKMELALGDLERDALIRDLESTYQTVIGRESEMRGDDRDWEEWLSLRAAGIDWKLWSRYKTYLGQQGLGTRVLSGLDDSTDTVLNLLGNPDREGTWDRRGLIVGLVQSGKTAHYVGIMNKAVDAGYKVIVVLTGFNENLRVQTQIRAEDGFLGYSQIPDPDNPRNFVARRCGVHMVAPLQTNIDSVTTRKSDFKTAIAKNFGIHPGGNPLVFVVKKNATVLKNLLSWVDNFCSATDAEGQKYVPEIPLLVIDDESDVGSVDTRKGAVDGLGAVNTDHDPSKINKQIRKLLSLFDQSSYLGYTATPFANVLIHDMVESGVDKEDSLLVGEDLFPRSFIVSLPTPDNHVGPSVIFGTEDSADGEPRGLPIIRDVNDASIDLSRRPSREERVSAQDCWMPESHKIHHQLLYNGKDEIPTSLRRAILSFILVCCARKLRGDENKHNSMLVHVTRFVDVQGRVYEQIWNAYSTIRDSLRNSVANSGLLDELRALWEIDDDSFMNTTQKISQRSGGMYQNPVHDWEEIKSHLRPIVESIEVRRIHGQSGEDLNYGDHPEGLNVIAIGGDKLSRGLTLEGLSVSYFLRCSKMYDTLMQMGRWFGYRPGYLDLCRLYTTPRLTRWFKQIAEATEELGREFDRMAILKCTPKEFGLRVRSHPQMMVTSAVKMRYGTRMQVSFQGDIVETSHFSRKANNVEVNWKAGSDLIEQIEASGAVMVDRSVDPPESLSPARYEWKNVAPDSVLNFLKSYKEHERVDRAKTHLLHEYVEKETRSDRLTRWRVVLAEGDSNASRSMFSIGPIEGHCVFRKYKVEDGEKLENLIQSDHYRVGRLVSGTHEAAGFTKVSEEYNRALGLAVKDWELEKRKKGVRLQRKRPTVPTSRAYREVRDNKEGVLILYPLDPKEAECDAKVPILGFAISFPAVGGLSATQVSYIVGNVYQQQELEFE